MEAMRFKQYIWPQNPKRVQVSYQRALKELPLLHGGSVVQDFGPIRRAVQGEGELWGENCREDFRALRALFQQEGPGLLTLPGHAPFYAHFSLLERKDEPFTGLIRYSFRFWEDGAALPLPDSQAGSHTVSPGESLWSVAAAHHTTVDRLLTENPDIGRPDRLAPGRRLKLP